MGLSRHSSGSSPYDRRSFFTISHRSRDVMTVPCGSSLCTSSVGMDSPCAASMSTVARRMLSFFGPHGRRDVRKSYAWSRFSKSRHQYRYAMATPGDRPMPAVQWQYTLCPSRSALSIAATARGRPSRSESALKSTNGMCTCFTSRCSICHRSAPASTFQYSLSLSCCVSNMHVTPSTSRRRSMSPFVVGCVPTIRLGRISW
mmetsp:Transcript_11651/g.48851  ORF Transcript_11651/g.48851 Transcript_11651/m.48851 type:complete len:202 (+) Transcript_11651:382-987(+)